MGIGGTNGRMKRKKMMMETISLKDSIELIDTSSIDKDKI
jgi:hypothetical protein